MKAMISAEHALWDAHLVKGAALERLSAYRDVAEHLRRVARAFERSFAHVAEVVRRTDIALRRSSLSSAEFSARLAASAKALDAATRTRRCTCGAGAGPLAITRHDANCPMRGVNDRHLVHREETP